MADDIKDMEKRVAELIGQLGAESKYLAKLKAQVLKEIYDIDHNLLEKAEDDLKDEEKLIRNSIGRTERFVNRDETKVEKDIKTLEENLPAGLISYLKSIDEKIHVGLNTLVDGLSRGRGKLAQEVAKAKELLKENPALAKQMSEKTIKDIDYIQKMLWGADIELQEYEKLLKYLESL